jgi:hypothetical protein
MVVPAVVAAITVARQFTGSAIDGPFQLYNALRRIAVGQRPGIDFQFFHGLGVPYAHYWLFRLLGGQFKDSELARQLISVLVFPLSFVVFFRAFGQTWRNAFCLSAGGMAITFALRLAPLMLALNGMVGLRSTLPVLFAAAMFRARSSRGWIGSGAILGLSLFLSTEQGMSAFMAFVVVSGVEIVRKRDRIAFVRTTGLTLTAAIATFVFAMLVVAGPAGTAGAIRYNFRLVPMDQYWFFGAPPNPFAATWSSLLEMSRSMPMVGVAVLLGVFASALYIRALWQANDDRHRPLALAFLAVYGLISCGSLLGVFVPVYADACWRTLILLALVDLTRLDLRRLRTIMARADTDEHETAKGSLLGVPPIVAATSISLCVLSLIAAPSILNNWLFVLPTLVRDPAAMRFTAAGIWPATLAVDAQTIRAHRGPGDNPPSLWSTYAGWAEARNGTFNPSFDYVIHALGPDNRREYAARFVSTHPTLVQTISPEYTRYEMWIENTSWDFYRELLRRYVVTAQTPWSFLWEQRPDTVAAFAVPHLEASLPVTAGQRVVHLPPTPSNGEWPATLLEIELSYRVTNPLRWLPIVGSNPRYLVQIGGALSQMPVTLDPYVSTMRFPLLARPGQTPELSIETFSLLPGAGITLTGVRIATVPIDALNAAWFRSLIRWNEQQAP